MLPLDKFTIKYSTVEKQGTAATQLSFVFVTQPDLFVWVCSCLHF